MRNQVRIAAPAEIPIPDFSGVISFDDIQQRFFAAAEKIFRGSRA
jgi:hypothetical protein